MTVTQSPRPLTHSLLLECQAALSREGRGHTFAGRYRRLVGLRLGVGEFGGVGRRLVGRRFWFERAGDGFLDPFEPDELHLLARGLGDVVVVAAIARRQHDAA